MHWNLGSDCGEFRVGQSPGLTSPLANFTIAVGSGRCWLVVTLDASLHTCSLATKIAESHILSTVLKLRFTTVCAHCVASISACTSLVLNLLLAQKSFETVEASASSVETDSIPKAVVIACVVFACWAIDSVKAHALGDSKWCRVIKLHASASLWSSAFASLRVLLTKRLLARSSSPKFVAMANSLLAISMIIAALCFPDLD